MKGLGILILIVVFFWLIWPSVSRWLKRKAMERAEDYMRASMGMPPRDKKRRKSEQNREREGYYYKRQENNPYGRGGGVKEPLIPKEYAEDVEFTETKDYSSTYTSVETDTSRKREIYHESQISDAEWTDIKESHTK